MKNRRKKLLVKLVALCLILVMAVPTYAGAAVIEPVSPLGSHYIASYQAYVYPAGGGEIRVYFSITGVTYMNSIGSQTVQIYESTDNSTWQFVHAFTYYNNPGMLGYGDYYHSGYVTYQGVAGRYYKAFVRFWAGKDGGGDARVDWTSAKLAT